MSTPQFFKISSPFQGVLLVEMNRYVYPVVWDAAKFSLHFSPPVNAFNDAFWRELGSVFRSIAKDGGVRVVVLASTLPKLFTAGLDRPYSHFLKQRV